MSTAAQILEPINELEQKREAKVARYRELVLEAASGEEYSPREVERVCGAIGKTLADFKKHVAIGVRRRMAVETLASNAEGVAAQARTKARADLEAAEKAAGKRLLELQRQINEELAPLRKALEDSQQARLDAGNAKRDAVQVLRTTASTQSTSAQQHAQQLASELEASRKGLLKSLHEFKSQLKQAIDGQHSEGMVNLLRTRVAKCERDLAEFDATTDGADLRDPAWLTDWRAFDLT